MTVKSYNLFNKFTIVCWFELWYLTLGFLKNFLDYSHHPIGDGSQTDNYVHPDWKRRINKDHGRVFGASIKCRNLGVRLLHRLHRHPLPHPSSSGSISFIVSIEGYFCIDCSGIVAFCALETQLVCKAQPCKCKWCRSAISEMSISLAQWRCLKIMC